MDFIYSFMKGVLEPFNPSDQKFIKAYWDSVFKVILNLYQRVLEVRVNRNVQTILPNHKEFYHGYDFSEKYDEWVVSDPTLPYTLEQGVWDIKCFVRSYTVHDRVALPYQLPSDAHDVEVITSSTKYTVSGTRILGTGTVEIKYYRNETKAFSASMRVLSSSEKITKITGKRCKYTPLTIESTGTFLEGGFLWDANYTFTGIELGSPITIGSVNAIVIEIVDVHTILCSPYTGAPGQIVPYTLSAYPYTYEMDGVPVIDGKYYIVKDNIIGFANRPTKTLTAREVLFENENPFKQYINGPDDLSSFKALWASIFLGAQHEYIELALGALIGLPYVDPLIGKCRLAEIEYSYTWIREPVSMTFDMNNEVYTPGEYFQANDNAIRLADGRFVKITKVISRYRARIEGIYEVGATTTGQVADWSFGKMTLEDKFGTSHYISVPDNTCPLYAPLDIIDKFKRLTSGIRIFDKTDRADYINYMTEDRFIVNDTVSYDAAKAKRRLVANTFVIESDISSVNMQYIDEIIPAWTQYILREMPEMSSVATWDAMEVLDIGFELYFGKMAGAIDFKAISVPGKKIYENVSWVDDLEYCAVYGTYDIDATSYFLRNTTDFFGIPWSPINVTHVKHIPSIGGYPPYPMMFDVNKHEEADLIEVWYDPTLPGLRFNNPVPGWALPSSGNGLWNMIPRVLQIDSQDTTIHRGGYMDVLSLERTSGEYGFSNVPELGILTDEYMPGVVAIGEMSANDNLNLEFPGTTAAGWGTVADAASYPTVTAPATGALLNFDYQRQGAKILGNVLLDGANSGNLYTIRSFTDHGEPEIQEISPSSAPVLAVPSVIGIYAFVLRHDNGTTVTTFGE